MGSIRDPGSSDSGSFRALTSWDNPGDGGIDGISLLSRPRGINDGLGHNLECSVCVRDFGQRSSVSGQIGDQIVEL